jgi:hypothetical protein
MSLVLVIVATNVTFFVKSVASGLRGVIEFRVTVTGVAAVVAVRSPVLAAEVVLADAADNSVRPRVGMRPRVGNRANSNARIEAPNP